MEKERMEERTTPSRKAIVIVEDSEPLAELMKDTLNAEPDYQAVAVGDGSIALDLIRSVKASLVLLDLSLPGIDGLQVYDLLQEDESTRDIPVIFVTADYSSPHFRERGYTNFIAKPFDLDDLLGRVAAVCRPPRRRYHHFLNIDPAISLPFHAEG